ncbi:hypothetical protein KZZ10_14790 [Alcaligenaceae bacterium LF4-65]|jgi:hypothetical protein|uniref:Uncharacterized protein n=1 Tax=Zwartia hollandica TaxID=324606 RepID=A0A953NCN3_9BURK|nr:hypothetical protein [Zwartia hollandica]MBZ1351908.1 hypothetical protein [Zwartia hollandica]
MSEYIAVALTFSFSLFIACSFVFVISGVYLFLFKIKEANQLYKHPYLREKNFNQFTISIRLTIVLDYFLRTLFSRTNLWFAKNANQLLSHVDPKELPMSVRWPIVGLWGSCIIGLVSMVTLWATLILGSK